MIKPLLVCLDLQRVFLGEGPLKAPRAGDALVHSRRLLKAARDQQWSIAHCYLKRWSESFLIAGDDARPAEGFEPLAHEMIFERATLSAYGDAAFDALMDRSGPNTVIAGLSASITWIATTIDAFERGHRFAYAPEALAAQCGFEADARQHEAVAHDVATHLGFTAVAMPPRGGARPARMRQREE